MAEQEPLALSPASQLLDVEPSLAIARAQPVATRLPSAAVLQQHHAEVGTALSAQLDELEQVRTSPMVQTIHCRWHCHSHSRSHCHCQQGSHTARC